MQQLKTYKRRKPGVLALCLVFLVLLWCSGGTVVWNVARSVSYEYVRSHGDELKFRDTIIVSQEQLKGSAVLTWMKHDEIRYRGQMYDIKKQIALPGGRIMLVGHYDDWDNELFSLLEHLLDPPPGQQPQKEKRAFYWLADAIIPSDPQPAYFEYAHVAITHFPRYDQAFYSKYRPDVPVPPPDACFA